MLFCLSARLKWYSFAQKLSVRCILFSISLAISPGFSMLNKHKHIASLSLNSKMPRWALFHIDFFFQAIKRCPLSVWYYLTGSSTEQASCERQLNSPPHRVAKRRGSLLTFTRFTVYARLENRGSGSIVGGVQRRWYWWATALRGPKHLKCGYIIFLHKMIVLKPFFYD